MEKKNIVVLGGGFGGITAATHIAKKLKKAGLFSKYGVILIDRNYYQIYTPLLYRYAAATGTAETRNVAWPVNSFIAKLPIDFKQGEITQIDLMNGDIHLSTGEEISAEFVVVAMGSESNDFGIPGVAQFATPLKTFDNAQSIRTKIKDLLARKPDAKIVIGGAGANGIEIASQIKYLYPNTDVTIVEAMASIIPGLDAKVATALTKRLSRLGVTLMLNAKIASVDNDKVNLDGGNTVPFDLMIWTAGIKAPTLVTQLPLTAQRGKPVADPNMNCLPQTPDLKLAPMVYALGDSVCFVDPATQRPMPSVAQVAITQGMVVAENVISEIAAKEGTSTIPKTRSYSPGKLPYNVYVISAGGPWAVAKLGSFIVTGRLGWFFKRLVALDYLMTVLPLWKAIWML